MLLGDQLEVGSALDNHAAYLEYLLGLLKESSQVLYQVLGEARQLVEVVCLVGDGVAHPVDRFSAAPVHWSQTQIDPLTNLA